MTIRHLIYRIVEESPQGRAGLAAQIGMGYQVLTNKLNPNCNTHHLTIVEMDMIADFTSANIKLAEHYAAKGGAVVVPLPEAHVASDMSLLDGFMECAIKSGDFAQEFNLAYSDGKIDAQEFARLKAKLYESITKQLAFLNRIDEIVSR